MGQGPISQAGVGTETNLLRQWKNVTYIPPSFIHIEELLSSAAVSSEVKLTTTPQIQEEADLTAPTGSANESLTV